MTRPSAAGLQDQLIQSEKMSAIGQLIAGIAHDLNNPLASVVGFADYPDRGAQRPAVAPGAAHGHPGGGRAGVEHRQEPAELRPQAGAPAPAHRPEAAARRDLPAAAQQSHGAPGGGHASRSSPTCRCRTSTPTRSSRSSSISSTTPPRRSPPPAGPARVVVRARRWLDGVAIDVVDDGPGMSEALAAQVFEPFFTTKPEGEGTGLGLSISQGIVREHGGRIMLDHARRSRGRPSPCSCRSRPSRRRPRPTREPRVADPAPPGAGGGRRAAHPALHAGDAGGVGPHPRGGERRRRRRWPSRRTTASTW